MAGLKIFCSDPRPRNLLKKVTPKKKKKKEISTQETFLWPIKDFQKYFMAHQYLPKIFHSPTKTLRPLLLYI